MTDVEIVHPVPKDEAAPWLHTLVTTLLVDRFADDFDTRVGWLTNRWDEVHTWGARDRGRWVATLGTEDRHLTVPGGTDLPVDALTLVSTLGTHRRRGLLSRMLTGSLREAHERGLPLSILVAAEWPIYGRFGYAPAIDKADYAYHPRRPHATLPAPPPGTVRVVDAAELRTLAEPVFAAARTQRAGQISREPSWWDRILGQNGYSPMGEPPNFVVHEGPSGVDGYLGWRLTRGFDIDGSLGALELADLVAATPDAYRDLWGYLGGIDTVDEIALHNRPVDEPVRWLLPDARALEQRYAGDFVWARLLDVPTALSTRRYAAPGQLVLDVVDDLCGGTVLLEVDEHGAASCTPAQAAADLRLDQRLLASAYLGGHRLAHLAAATGGVEELSAGALARADLMFSTAQAPWCQTGF